MLAVCTWFGGRGWRHLLAALVAAGLLFAACGTGAGSASTGSSGVYAVLGVREPLTTNRHSSVVHDNEVMALASHTGRLFAATDQWEYSGPSAYGQVLVKNSASRPWEIFEHTQSTRVQALDSFAIPRDQGLGPRHSLLITQAIVNGRSKIQWLLDGARSFASANSYTLSSTRAAVRSFGAHESGGVWAVYAGVGPTGILRGTWSKTKRTLVFSSTPELQGASPAARGLKSQKVTAFADCGGALYVTINTKMFRRNDGALPHGAARWVLVYEEPPVGPFNSGLRGLTCVTHERSPGLLFSTEGSGDAYRLDHLPRGQLDHPATVSPGHPFPGMISTLEFTPFSAIDQLLAREGATVPATGTGSIDYVIAAYNNFETIKLDGLTRQVVGFEWGYRGTCPPTRTCAPSGFDAAACFAVRTDQGSSPTYVLRCLSGPQFRPSSRQPSPVRSGQARAQPLRRSWLPPRPSAVDLLGSRTPFTPWTSSFPTPTAITTWAALVPRTTLAPSSPARCHELATGPSRPIRSPRAERSRTSTTPTWFSHAGATP